MLELLLNRRSIRSFQDKPVEKEKIDEIVKCALLAPSSRSIKPWEFVFVDDKELLLKLSKSKEHGSSFLSGAPLGIAVIADAAKSDVWIEDTSIAAIIIQLAAQRLGLGSCWIQIRKRSHIKGETSESYVKKLLSISDEYTVECLIALGYPAEKKVPNDENKLPYLKAHYNKHGSSLKY